MKKILTNLYEFVNPLFCENGNLSLGRISFWFLLFLATYKYWWLGKVIPIGLKELLFGSFSYNLLKKMPYFNANSETKTTTVDRVETADDRPPRLNG